MTQPVPGEAFELARLFASFATGGDEKGWEHGAQLLGELDGAMWLLIDHAARRGTYTSAPPVSGDTGWSLRHVAEPSGFVATVTSWHFDGRIRERATRILGDNRGSLRAAALSVRLLDHVPQVRAAAVAGLAEYLAPEQAEAALDVALAGRNRRHGPAAVESLTGILRARNVFEPIVRAMLASEVTARRRWAYSVAHDEQMLTPDMLLDAIRAERDQWLQGRCARWLAEVSRPADLRAMLEARPAEARLVALSTIADADLPQERLAVLLTDRSPRVREAARWRATQRGIDVADWYASRLVTDEPTPAVIVRCLHGAAAVGAAEYVELFRPYLSHGNAAVRAAAVDGFGQLAPRGQILDTLTPLLLDPSAKVCATAARVLSRAGATVTDAAAAWNSAQPWSRAAAWRLCRARGNWDRVEADLRACVDSDAALRENGVVGIFNWLTDDAARTWGILTDDQRGRIAELLDRSELHERARDMVAFTAGITRPT